MKGLEISTGDQLWAVSAPTDGFAVTGSQLRIQHEGAVSSFDFTDLSNDESVTADTGFDESISALPALKLPSEDDIRNAKLEIPPACADLTSGKEAKQDFADGKTAEGEYGESMGLMQGLVTPDLACLQTSLEGQTPCHSPTRKNSATTQSAPMRRLDRLNFTAVAPVVDSGVDTSRGRRSRGGAFHA